MVEIKEGMKIKAHFKVEYIPEKTFYAGGMYRIPDREHWLVKEYDSDLTFNGSGVI